MSYYSIAIDGPAGAGKSTIAKSLANKLGFIYVDTGAMYRAISLYFIRNNIDALDTKSIKEACKEIDITIEYKNGEQIVLLNKENVNSFIRTEAIGKMASTTSAYSDVRIKLLELQRNLAKTSNVIMDGRDIGTCVLPNANLKIYLTASVEERALRRYNELKTKNIECNLEQIMKDIEDRDYADMNRDMSPLKQSEDAILIDSSTMTIYEVVDKIIELTTF